MRAWNRAICILALRRLLDPLVLRDGERDIRRRSAVRDTTAVLT